MTDRTQGAPRTGALPSVMQLLGRLAALAVIDAVALLFVYSLFAGDLLIGGVALLVITLAINVVFLVDRLYPLRWISPGVLLLVLMVIYPLFYTAYTAFTNYGSGHLLSKGQVIERLESQYVAPEAASLAWRAYRSPGGDFLLLLTDPEGNQFIGHPQTGLEVADFSDPRFGPIDPEDDLPTSIGDYEKLARAQTLRYLTALQDVRIEGEIEGEAAEIRIVNLDAAELGQQRYRYDPARDLIVDRAGVEYRSEEGLFVADDGTELSPGFVDVVGPRNFLRALEDPRIRDPFIGVFVWTFFFAALSVVLTFSLGLGLALILNDSRLPLKGILRTLMIIPYTIPAFISALIWVGLLNPLFGPINAVLSDLLGISPSWFSDPTLAKVAILTVQMWLGYPYMMLVCLGALQSIPGDLYEAARIDGATAFQQFKRITFPLLLVALAPLLIGAFAFNFNNFTVVELVTQGGPATPGAGTPAGQTDILISYTFRLAFAAGRGQDYAFASAIALMIFVIIAVITIFNFRLSRRLEELV